MQDFTSIFGAVEELTAEEDAARRARIAADEALKEANRVARLTDAGHGAADTVIVFGKLHTLRDVRRSYADQPGRFWTAKVEPIGHGGFEDCNDWISYELVSPAA